MLFILFLFIYWLRWVLVVALKIFALHCRLRDPLIVVFKRLVTARGLWFPDQGPLC